MCAEKLLGGLLGLALFAFAGRVILSLLPPGEPGYHQPIRLPATWAASHLLGLVAFHALCVLVAPFPLDVTVVGFATPFAVLAVARLVTLPGAMVPRPPRPPEPTGFAARALLGAIALAVLLGPALVGADLGPARAEAKLVELHAFGARTPLQEGVLGLVPPASLAALAVLLLHGLAQVGVAALPRRAAAALLLTTPALWRPDVLGGDGAVLLMLFGAGCAFTATWRRCADPRAMALAAVAFAGCAAWRPAAVPLGAAGIAALALTTHRNARPSVLVWCAAALLLAFPPWQLLKWVFLPFAHWRGDLVLDPDVIGWRPLLDELARLDHWGLTWVAGLAGALVGAALWLRRRRGLEVAAVALALALALLLHPVVLALQDIAAGVDVATWRHGLLRALPAAALAAGLALGGRRP